MRAKACFESAPFTCLAFFVQSLFRFNVILPINDIVNI
jgi:hypothetical protein